MVAVTPPFTILLRFVNGATLVAHDYSSSYLITSIYFFEPPAVMVVEDFKGSSFFLERGWSFVGVGEAVLSFLDFLSFLVPSSSFKSSLSFFFWFVIFGNSSINYWVSFWVKHVTGKQFGILFMVIQSERRISV
jgi:hypothetical protein